VESNPLDRGDPATDTARRNLNQHFGVLEQILLDQTVTHLRELIGKEVSRLQGKASLKVELVTDRIIVAYQITVIVRVINSGLGPAYKVRLDVAMAHDGQLAKGIENPLPIPPSSYAEFNFVFPLSIAEQVESIGLDWTLKFEDLTKGHFQSNGVLAIHLLRAPSHYSWIEDPYITGGRLDANSPVFVGREQEFDFIRNAVPRGNRNNHLVLTGLRRVGKSSLISHLPNIMGSRYACVNADLHDLDIGWGMGNFLNWLSDQICEQICEQTGVASPEPESFIAQPKVTFEQKLLAPVFEALGERHLLIALDEFELLEDRVTDKRLEPDVFSYVRYLMMQYPRLAFVFVGVKRPEALSPDYWYKLFNVCIHRRIGLLDSIAARRLITQPVADTLIYDGLALRRIEQLFSSYPFYLQVLCSSVIQHARREQRTYVLAEHIEKVIPEVFDRAGQQLIALWRDFSQMQQHALLALSYLYQPMITNTPAQVTDYMNKRYGSVTETQVREVLYQLHQSDILWLHTESLRGEGFSWRIGALPIWIKDRFLA